MSRLQYLSSYAESEATCPPPTGRRYEHVVVIPAFDEVPSFVDSLLPAGNSHTLWIVVANCSTGRSDGEKARTRYLAEALSAGALPLPLPGISLRPTSSGDLLLIDRCSEGRELPTKQGVGLARKIGCDLALAWQKQGIVESPWIHCTDADVTLPSNYFAAARELDTRSQIAALCYPFWHECEEASVAGRSLALYEMSLRYYVLGLRWARSPYAFHSIGSTMAVRASAYLQVRGMPKRQAGEDFYLLGKLAKIGHVVTPDCEPMRIAQRHSQRTPFGTGPATTSIADNMREGVNFCVYAPQSFALLREWLALLNEFSASCDMGILDRISHQVLSDALPLDTEKHLRQAASQCKSPHVRRRRLKDWFDGFRTLKLIHALRDRGLEDVPWRQAFDSAPFVPERNPSETLRAAMARVEQES